MSDTAKNSLNNVGLMGLLTLLGGASVWVVTNWEKVEPMLQSPALAALIPVLSFAAGGIVFGGIFYNRAIEQHAEYERERADHAKTRAVLDQFLFDLIEKGSEDV